MLKAFDGMSNVIKSAVTQSDAEFDKLNKKLESTADSFDKYGKKAAAIGGIMLGASALNAKTAGDFEQGMNNISTLIDTNTESLNDMSKKVLEIGKNSPKALNDLTEGLYSIRSAGINAADQFNVLKGSEMVAVTGLATTAEAVDVVTSSINAFNLSGEKQNKLYDILFKYVKQGKTNISEFSRGFGNVAGVVASAGIELDEYLASVAAMTTTGLKANNAHTQMSAAISSLTRSSKEQIEIFNKLGAKSFKDLVAKSGSMVNAFKRIDKAVGGNEAKMVALMGSINGYKAVLALTNTVNGKYVENLDLMRNGGNWLEEAYQKQMGGLNNQMAITKNNLQAVSIRFGTGLLPVIKSAGAASGMLVKAFDALPDGLVNFISIATAGIGAVLAFGGAGTMAIGGIIKNIVFLRKVFRGFSIASWANPALLPIIGITAAIAGLSAGVVYCYNHFEGFKNFCQGTWEVIKAGGAWLAVLGNSFINGANSLWNFISPAAKFAATILSWTTPIGWTYHAIRKLIDVVGNLIQKMGGLRGIGDKLKNFAKDANLRANEVNNSVKAARGAKNADIDGSHLQGLNRVPFDGYRAELHKDEAVLTASEADTWRNQNNYNTSSLSRITLNYSPKIQLSGEISQISDIEAKFLQLLRSHKEDIYRMLIQLNERAIVRSY